LNKPTEEQIKELWEWCGFGIDGVGIWHCPDGITELGGMPKVTLDNLFKWAVPKVFRVGYNNLECRLDSRRDGDGYMWILTSPYRLNVRSEYLTDPALALFWAIYKVIKEKA